MWQNYASRNRTSDVVIVSRKLTTQRPGAMQPSPTNSKASTPQMVMFPLDGSPYGYKHRKEIYKHNRAPLSINQKIHPDEAVRQSNETSVRPSVRYSGNWLLGRRAAFSREIVCKARPPTASHPLPANQSTETMRDTTIALVVIKSGSPNLRFGENTSAW